MVEALEFLGWHSWWPWHWVARAVLYHMPVSWPVLDPKHLPYANFLGLCSSTGLLPREKARVREVLHESWKPFNLYESLMRR